MQKKRGIIIILLVTFLSIPVQVQANTLGRAYYEIEISGGNYFRYIIQPGDTLYELSQRFKVDLDTLQELNSEVEPTNLLVGEEVKININDDKLDYYIALPNDSLWKLTQRHNLDLEEIVEYNGFTNPNYILKDEVIRLPEEIFTARNRDIKVIEFESQDNELRVSGLARVFEAHVSYALETEDGQVLKEGGTTASIAGPHWGSFEIELIDIPSEADYLTVFSVSMKDGSRQSEMEYQL
ncbi:LysM peptidoglycan-binding domain-containing protein [Natroniella acetigena]|uniref:LysM peptidoglycan-binding domain-containing protein n=1 Tax=Natroniella acetigena TaxID=52004 RepID=UPI00200B8E83|nr:LysM peptidoglycan-binding domain-containing protein [Natroniella acetigena]MCK8828402.1 LysM peptidoglycan-binding domain-containing protein [Natroniella acetigena]